MSAEAREAAFTSLGCRVSTTAGCKSVITENNYYSLAGALWALLFAWPPKFTAQAVVWRISFCKESYGYGEALQVAYTLILPPSESGLLGKL